MELQDRFNEWNSCGIRHFMYSMLDMFPDFGYSSASIMLRDWMHYLMYEDDLYETFYNREPHPFYGIITTIENNGLEWAVDFHNKHHTKQLKVDNTNEYVKDQKLIDALIDSSVSEYCEEALAAA